MSDATPRFPVLLPSRGVLYGDKLPDGKVFIRRMGTNEESMLFSQGNQGIDRVANVLKICTQLPAGLEASELLLQDRMALMFALRVHTFGPLYKLSFRCSFCKEVVKHSVNLIEDLNDKVANTTLVEPIDVKLADSGDVLTLRFLRGSDEERIAKFAKRTRMASNDASDPSHIYRLALQIVTINGAEVNQNDREIYVRQLSAGDSARIRIAVDSQEPGIDTTIYPSCTACGATNEMELPFTAEFFRPTSM
jgi:hypothetical protein